MKDQGMLLKEVLPTPMLSALVRLYRIIDFTFPDDRPIPAKAYPPRPEQCLQFFVSPTLISYPGQGKPVAPKNALLVGQHTIMNNRTIYQKFLSVQVVFQPGALYRVLGVPAGVFSNQLIDAADVFGDEIELVTEQLYHAVSHAQMIMVIEAFLSDQQKRQKKDVHAMDTATQLMLTAPHQYNLDWMVNHNNLCHRQFDRRFSERMGITAKEYLRVIRFYNAYLLKNRNPEQNWFSIAIQCGYYDYQHLVKDYKDFTGYTPPRFFALDSPERVLGAEEVY